jgi:fructose-1,6-bisphosphatase/inositol monophosphatase family enzyme
VNGDALNEAVAAMMRHAAETIILPRHRALAAHEVGEKAPGEVVTIADRESEAWLTVALSGLLPEARVIGEEACETAPELLDGIERGLVWLVDPLDGTANFAAGSEHFAVMVALVADGETQAGWILHPLTGRMHYARLGGGAFIDGERIRARTTGVEGLVGSLSTRFVNEQAKVRVERVRARLGQALPGLMCAGAEYPRCIDGTQDFAMYWRSLPWDHAPGALFVTEAGGKVGWIDGGPYRVGDTRPGMMATASPAIWERVVAWAR